MAVIVEFKPSKTKPQSARIQNHPDMGIIVFFTGIRYERMPTLIDKSAASSDFTKKGVCHGAISRTDARS